jgi:hypothetical protein
MDGEKQRDGRAGGRASQRSQERERERVRGREKERRECMRWEGRGREGEEGRQQIMCNAFTMSKN